MKTTARALSLIALALLLPACGTSGGVNNQANLSAGVLPLVGSGVQTAGQVYDEADRAAGRLAVGLVTAPFEAVEGALGMSPSEVRSTQGLGGRFSPEERLAHRREARGLPAPPEIRVARRQSQRRYDERRVRSGMDSGSTLRR